MRLRTLYHTSAASTVVFRSVVEKKGERRLAAVYSHTGSPPHYHRRWWTLLPGSGWDRVFPHRSCHQLHSPIQRVMLVLLRIVLLCVGLRIVLLCVGLLRIVLLRMLLCMWHAKN